ncbi:hypothetical protein [Motilimonas eburnea]|uniref:hypothetical protein n=1 Tax=Motilimonas eburnea TaxID=1737488 RepID=UPI001E6519E8|nr:hypothetical protein [Motilimonas eburnea]MCE2570305.1 hypothetical protein [Motilimonas eburnea]
MQISQLQQTTHTQYCQLSAKVSFENQQQAHQVYFRVPLAFSHHIRLCFEPFLFSLLPIALVKQEQHLHIEGALCPDSLANATSILKLFQLWYQHPHLPKITAQSYQVQQPTSTKAGLFLSGGVDSMASFCRSVQTYPADHPRRFAHAFFVYGMDLGDPNKPDARKTYQQTVHALTQFLQPYGCTLVPVTTNVRQLYGHWRFYADYHFGPLMAGIAHALSAKTSEFTIALDNQIQNYVPRGSHPLLNKYFSSSFLTSQGLLEAYTRLEKYAFFEGVPDAIGYLRVCHSPPTNSQYTNCGQCEKCVRTKLELLVNGYLEQGTNFADQAITVQHLQQIQLSNILELEYYQAIETALTAQQYDELAKIIRAKLTKAWRLRFKHKLLQWDQRHLDHRLLKTKNKLLAWLKPSKKSETLLESIDNISGKG